MPDLGISDEDVFWLKEGELAVRVHNIGSRAARNIRVRISALQGDGEEKVGEAVISYLDSPLSLDPQTKLVSFLVERELREQTLLVAIDPDDGIYEITERNNTFEFAAVAAAE
jgi:subtilase family serine protease